MSVSLKDMPMISETKAERAFSRERRLVKHIFERLGVNLTPKERRNRLRRYVYPHHVEYFLDNQLLVTFE
jgi:hypothetical protein